MKVPADEIVLIAQARLHRPVGEQEDSSVLDPAGGQDEGSGHDPQVLAVERGDLHAIGPRPFVVGFDLDDVQFDVGVQSLRGGDPLPAFLEEHVSRAKLDDRRRDPIASKLQRAGLVAVLPPRDIVRSDLEERLGSLVIGIEVALAEGPAGVWDLLLGLEIGLVHDRVADAQPSSAELRLPHVRGPPELAATEPIRIGRVIPRAFAEGLGRFVEFETPTLDQDDAATLILEFSGECQSSGTGPEDADVRLDLRNAL